MKISVNKAHFPVTVLGPGRRIGVWLQGCSIRCKGCVSLDTWARDPGREMTVARLLQWCRESSSGSPDGITISGGEPFDQPGALAAFLDGLLDWRTSAGLDFDILCYSGYPLSTLRRKHAALLGRLDAVLAEPYIDSQPTLKPWRGSDNQRLELLTERARAHFAAPLAQSTASLDKRIQVFVDSQRVWYVGIPARGDLAALEQACGENGVDFSQVSWRQ